LRFRFRRIIAVEDEAIAWSQKTFAFLPGKYYLWQSGAILCRSKIFTADPLKTSAGEKFC